MFENEYTLNVVFMFYIGDTAETGGHFALLFSPFSVLSATQIVLVAFLSDI